MKTKIKTIILTFLATTVFWSLVIAGITWFSVNKSGASFVDNAAHRGFVCMMSAKNGDSQSVTYTVEELSTNTAKAGAVLLERKLPPTGEFWIGIKKSKTEKKP